MGLPILKYGYSDRFITLDKSLWFREIAVNSAGSLGRCLHCKSETQAAVCIFQSLSFPVLFINFKAWKVLGI